MGVYFGQSTEQTAQKAHSHADIGIGGKSKKK